MQLELRGITKRFPGDIANDNVHLTLKTGEVLCLIGEKSYNKLIELSYKLSLIGIVLGISIFVIGMIFYSYLGVIFTKEKIVLVEFYNVFWIVLIMQKILLISSGGHILILMKKICRTLRLSYKNYLNKNQKNYLNTI